jgi:hypothetical protein
MKLIVTIDVPDAAAPLAPALEERVGECVRKFSETVHVGFYVYGVRLLSDQLYKAFGEKIHGPAPRSGRAWVRWFGRASTRHDV